MNNPTPIRSNNLFRFGAVAFAFLLVGQVLAVRADTYTWISPNTSLEKSGNWNDITAGTTGAGDPGPGDIGEISQSGSTGPIGWNDSTASFNFGTIDLISGASNMVVGNYAKSSGNPTVTITLSGGTINSVANTIIANSSGTTALFQNDIAPSGDDLTESGLTTYVLSSTTSNVIQSSGAGSNIVIDNAITNSTGAIDPLTYYGGGTASVAGSTLELGAGSKYDVTGGNSTNPSVTSFASNGGAFTSTATVQTTGNSFTGGLTVGGAVSGQYGTVQIDGAAALPTTGTVTVNANSQLYLNNTVTTATTYGGTTQNLILNGTGTGGVNNGALNIAASNTTTWQGTVSVPTVSSVYVQSSSTLTFSGAVSGAGRLQVSGPGTLKLSGANTAFSGGTLISAGSTIVSNISALGTGAVQVSGGTLSSTVTGVTTANLTLSSGTLQLTSSASSTFQLSSGSTFTMTGGSLTFALNSNGLDSIASSGGAGFTISGGTLNLNNSITNYSATYDVLNGFTSGSVSNLSITNYDTTDYSAVLNNEGVLSFQALSVPEPSTWAMLAAALAGIVWQARRRGLKA
jgi:fibronectin-binding autotransporter adhesin